MVETLADDARSRDPRRRTRRERILRCERCAGRLIYDGDGYSCLQCGHVIASVAVNPRRRVTQAEMLDGLIRFRAEVGQLFEESSSRPLPGSIAERELSAATDEDIRAALELATTLAQQSMTAAGHALIALARGLEPPAPEYGTWGTCMAILRASSLVSWLSEGGLPPAERALRSLAVEGEELASDLPATAADKADGEAFPAGAHPIEVSRDRTGRIHDGRRLPAVAAPVTEALAARLGTTAEFRMFEAAAMGRPRALLHATSVAAALGAPPSEAIAALQVSAATGWYARAAWELARWIFHPPHDETRDILERGFDGIGLPNDPAMRPWRAGTPKRRPRKKPGAAH